MPIVMEQTATTWEEFREFVVQGPFCDGATPELWRGQGDSSWPLASSLERTVLDHRCPGARIYPYGGAFSGSGERFWVGFDKLRVRYLERFGQEVIALGHALPASPERNIFLATLGRHHGLATRLLDWTTKPFIASFFAATDLLDRVRAGTCGEDGTATVFRLVCTDGLRSEGLDVHLDFYTPGVSRLHAQHGAFTELRVPGYLEVEGYVRDKVRSRGPVLTKCHLTVPAARQGIVDLASHGISNRSLFPDFTGAAQEVNRLFGDELRSF